MDVNTVYVGATGMATCKILQVMTIWYAVGPQVAGRDKVMEQQAGFKPLNKKHSSFCGKDDY